MNRRAPLRALLCALGLALSGPAAADHDRSQRVDRKLAGWPLADFALVDHDGRAFTRERLKGQWTFLLFGDTRCREPCQAALSALTGMYRRIAPTDHVRTTQVLFVSLDAERDTPDRLRRYLVPFDERFIGATGTRRNLKWLTEELEASYLLPGQSGGGDRRYTGSMWLIGPDGFVRGEFLPPFDVKLLTAQYLITRSRR